MMPIPPLPEQFAELTFPQQLMVDLIKAIYKWKTRYREYFVKVTTPIPAGATITATFRPPEDEVWFKEEYRFLVDELDVIRVSYYSDGMAIFKDLVLGETEVTAPIKDIATLTVREAVFSVTNLDSINDHEATVMEKYMVIPKDEYEELAKLVV